MNVYSIRMDYESASPGTTRSLVRDLLTLETTNVDMKRQRKETSLSLCANVITCACVVVYCYYVLLAEEVNMSTV